MKSTSTETKAIAGVLLDRDGVLNVNWPGHVGSWHSWAWLPGALKACRHLAEQRIPVAVVTNQSAIGRGLMSKVQLGDIHRRLARALHHAGISNPVILHCPHAPEKRCWCRKPAPGLIFAATNLLGVSPRDCVMIGDHETDVYAASSAGCRSAHVGSGRGQPPPPGRYAGYLGAYPDLDAAVHALFPSPATVRSEAQ